MINIYNYHNKIIYTSQTATSMIEAVEEAVKKGINLSGARLSLSLITIVFCLKNGIDYCEIPLSRAISNTDLIGNNLPVELQEPSNVFTAINDHICRHCGNNRVSKSEKSCWKCGGSL